MKRHDSSSLIPILAISVLGFALATCTGATSNPSDGGLSDRTGSAANPSDLAGGTIVFSLSCRLSGLMGCPSGEGFLMCEGYKVSHAGVADFQEICENSLEGTFSMDPCPSNFREKCESGDVSLSYYHDCELSDSQRRVIEGACASQGGDLATR